MPHEEQTPERNPVEPWNEPGLTAAQRKARIRQRIAILEGYIADYIADSRNEQAELRKLVKLVKE
jgi:hypothetical protein